MAKLPRFQAGQVLAADDLNRIVAAVLAMIAPPGDHQQSECIWVGKASGTITARSGSTPGTGTVRVWTYDGSAMADSGVDLDVLNFSAATGGIADATWVSVGRDGNGRWYVLSAECVEEA